MNPRHRNYTLLIFLLSICLLCGSFAGVPSSAGGDEPASEGKPITPAGSLVQDLTTRQTAVGALPVDLVRSPDKLGPGGEGRFLLAVNSGYGVQFNAAGNRGQQSLGVIDLNAKPAAVIQNVYFPSPQSVNFGVVFSPAPQDDGSYALYVSGGFENKIWIFRFQADSQTPITPASPGPNTNVEAPFIDVTGFAFAANSPRYNSDRAPVYPTGIAISPDGNTLFVANNLGDSLGVIQDLRGTRKLIRVDLRTREDREQFVYPYGVAVVPEQNGSIKAYVSCWNENSVAVIRTGQPVSRIAVGRHPTVMRLNGARTRLYVANSNDDSVSVIDTKTDKEIERISVRLSEGVPPGNSPEGLALRGDDLYVANAHSNSVAVVELSSKASGEGWDDERSKVRGFIPTGQYPSAVAVVGPIIFVGNGKGTGVQNSSLMVDNSGRVPNAPNERFPAGSGRGQGGQYSVTVVVGNISAVNVPDDPSLVRYTQQVMRNNGLLGQKQASLFAGRSPIKHVIYVIKENRTYDQVFGDVEQSGDGTKADGDASLAIFGAGAAVTRPNGQRQDITPNHRALALRFGLFDRFFVNSEASPDGHNWSTAAFSTDYVDKAFRWNYSRRGRTYDFEGFNRLPNYEPVRNAPSLFGPKATSEDVVNFMQRYVPYLNGARDVAEPETLYLWDAAARSGLTYRNYGEFIATLSESDVNAIRANRDKTYPDLTPTVSAFGTKKSLENRFSTSYRNFDMDTPDSMTVDSYRAARESNVNALISDSHADTRFRGNSRLGVWLAEFQKFAAERASGSDRFPNLSVLRLSNDHTDGLAARKPTPQFYVADNDYALGLLVEAVSNSAYWKDTAIVVVEDDAQDGPDHVDAHRSVALLISAYNRPGALIHEFHNTVSLIRTIEMLLGMDPMNQLDATATPINIFRGQADLRPYKAQLPDVALDNLMTPPARDAATAYWMQRTAEQDLAHADMADPEVLNRIIWFSVKGNTPMPEINRLPAFDAMRLGLQEEREEIAEERATKKRKKHVDLD
ncbi:MAG TPA: bifunctional YncE family protein/alkaline phosphatase family protein [Pyrinomonadaceae bacterium]|nr:bifunctional YncE family protein/alkaline phosphatase family protein [Pyrinomonadaceae bacterium]